MTAQAPMNPDGPRVVGPLPGKPPGGERTRRRRLVRTQFGLVVGSIALCLLVGIAGVPGAEEPEAGNGSAKLRRGWAEEWAARAETATPARAPLDVERRGLELDGAKR